MHVTEKRYEGAAEITIGRPLCAEHAAEHAAELLRDNRRAPPDDKEKSCGGDSSPHNGDTPSTPIMHVSHEPFKINLTTVVKELAACGAGCGKRSEPGVGGRGPVPAELAPGACCRVFWGPFSPFFTPQNTPKNS